MNPTRRSILQTAAAAATLALASRPVAAQAPYPNKPITIIVPYPPGADTDAIARLFAEKLAERLKQTVLVDNKPGAGGSLGALFVSRAPADGYTLLFTPNPFTTAPLVMKLSGSAKYDPLNDFEPIAFTATQPNLLVANPRLEIKSFPQLVAAAKAGRPITYGTPGAGSPMHIIGEWINKEAGVKMTHVPYRGVAPAVTDVVAGHVDTAWVTFGAVRQYLASGRLVPLAIGDAQRSVLNLDVPTVAEFGYKDVVVGSWNAFFAPKGTPSAIVQLLNGHLNEILKQPQTIEKLATFGALPAGGKPEALSQVNARDYAVIGKVVRDLNLAQD